MFREQMVTNALEGKLQLAADVVISVAPGRVAQARHHSDFDDENFRSSSLSCQS